MANRNGGHTMSNDNRPKPASDDVQREICALEAIRKAEGPLGRQFEAWVIETRSVRCKKQADAAGWAVGWWIERGALICPHCLLSSPWPAGFFGEACCPHCKQKFDVPDNGPLSPLHARCPTLSQRDRNLLRRCTTVLIAILGFILLISVPPLDSMWAYHRGFWSGVNGWYGNPYEGRNAGPWKAGWIVGHQLTRDADGTTK